MKKSLYFFPFLVFLAFGCNQQASVQNNSNQSNLPLACSQEAKLCSDGSYVSRTGPNCEFAACPAPASNQNNAIPPVTLTSGIQGTVTIGPTCPVQRDPPDPNCNDKPYQATIKVQTADGQKQITQFTTGSDGKFKVSLAPGTYLLVPANAQVYPRAGSQQVTVEKNKYTPVTIMYDSGIR